MIIKSHKGGLFVRRGNEKRDTVFTGPVWDHVQRNVGKGSGNLGNDTGNGVSKITHHANDGKIFLESRADAVTSTSSIFATTNTEDSFLIHGKALSIVAENNSSGQTYGALTIDGFASLQADELANIKSSQYGLYSYAVGSQSKIDLTGSANKIEASSRMDADRTDVSFCFKAFETLFHTY